MIEYLNEISDVAIRHIEVMMDQKAVTRENVDQIKEIAQSMLPPGVEKRFVIGILGDKVVVGWGDPIPPENFVPYFSFLDAPVRFNYHHVGD